MALLKEHVRVNGLKTPWQETAATIQAGLRAKIPKDWFLSDDIVATQPRSVIPIFEDCGLLTPRELEITDVVDVVTLLKRIHAREWSAYEVTVAFCKRAAIAQQLINCLIDVDFDGAMKRAKELDDYLASTGTIVGPLHGLPISIKDLTHVRGMKMTLGLVALANYTSEEDAVVVKALRMAGAVLYVKTTMPQTGMALETTSNLFGRTLNPFNTALVCGGSSGGEAALNGCHGAPIGVATDIGGSIRAPAAFNGLYGFRPTSRRFSYMGNGPPFTGQAGILSTIGPVGRSLNDIELMFRVWSDAEPWLYDPAVMAKRWSFGPSATPVTIGVMYWDEVVMPHPPIRRALKAVVKALQAAGHEVVEIKPYKHREAWDMAFGHYFHTGGKLVRELLDAAGETAIPAVGRFLDKAKELSIFELTELNAAQRRYQTEYLAHWNFTATQTSHGKPVDAILTPSMASASFPHDFLPWWGYLSQWNLLDYPAVVLPITTVQASDVKDDSYVPVNDFDRENYELYDPQEFLGAPVSVQLIGRSMHEEELLALSMVVDDVLKKSGPTTHA